MPDRLTASALVPILRQVVVSVVLLVAAGALAGVVWVWLWTPPTGVVVDHRWVQDETGLRGDFSATGSYVAVGFSGHGFKLSPAVGHMMAALIADGPTGHPDLPTFRLSRFADNKPIRGTYGDWLMC